MAIYIVGYDLHPKQGETYDELINVLKKIGEWWHCLDSTWLIETTLSAVELRDAIWRHMRSDDQLLVIQYGQPRAAWNGFNQNCGDWLKRKL